MYTLYEHNHKLYISMVNRLMHVTSKYLVYKLDFSTSIYCSKRSVSLAKKRHMCNTI